MDNLEIWHKVARPPETALKKIVGGRLAGMTDINPQWRLKAMTEVFGPCGIGWKRGIEKLWTENGPNGEVMAFALVNVWTRDSRGAPWEEPIPGIGGSALVAKESSGLRPNDEAFKMAVTDALSVALKCLGVASDIYERKYDGSKYTDAPNTSALEPPKRLSERPPARGVEPVPAVVDGEKRERLTLDGELSPEEKYGRCINDGEMRSLMGLLKQHGVSTDALKTFCADTWQLESKKEIRMGMLGTLGEWIVAQGKAA